MQSIHRITGVDTPNNANNGPGNRGWLFELFGVSAPVIRWNSYIILIIFQFKPKSLNNADNNSVNNSHRTGLRPVLSSRYLPIFEPIFCRFSSVCPSETNIGKYRQNNPSRFWGRWWFFEFGCLDLCFGFRSFRFRWCQFEVKSWVRIWDFEFCRNFE